MAGETPMSLAKCGPSDPLFACPICLQIGTIRAAKAMAGSIRASRRSENESSSAVAVTLESVVQPVAVVF